MVEVQACNKILVQPFRGFLVSHIVEGGGDQVKEGPKIPIVKKLGKNIGVGADALTQ